MAFLLRGGLDSLGSLGFATALLAALALAFALGVLVVLLLLAGLPSLEWSESLPLGFRGAGSSDDDGANSSCCNN